MVDVVLVSQACIVFIVDLVEVLQCANVSSNRAEGGRKTTKNCQINKSYSQAITLNFIQIYHVWDGYLRKIPVDRRTILVSRLVLFANTPSKHDISV